MSGPKFPGRLTAAHALLTALLDGPGTFYQVCERAGIGIESARDEAVQRALFEALLTLGHASLSGITYSISRRARDALRPPAPHVGQVAGPHHRGPCRGLPLAARRPPHARGA